MEIDKIKEAQLELIEHASKRLRESQDKLEKRREFRDKAIIDAIEDGITMYAIAKRAGISNAAIAKIRNKNQENK